jgi:hypothetical protein
MDVKKFFKIAGLDCPATLLENPRGSIHISDTDRLTNSINKMINAGILCSHTLPDGTLEVSTTSDYIFLHNDSGTTNISLTWSPKRNMWSVLYDEDYNDEGEDLESLSDLPDVYKIQSIDTNQFKT